MHPRHLVLPALASVIVACTYNEYKTYNEVVDKEDAGLAGAGPIGAAGAGQSGTGGAAGQAGGAGTAGTGGGTDDGACTGCLRLSLSSATPRNIRLEFANDENLSSSQMRWRIRVRDFTGDVFLSFYAQSGNAADENAPLNSLSLDSTAGWQEVGADLSILPPFTPPVLLDGGGVAGGGFAPGFPFDKSRIERVGVFVTPNVPFGVFTPLSIEIDAVTFSGHPDLSASFASNDGGLRLVDADGASTEGATLEQVGE